jgi:hypothetical protein
MQAFEGIDQLFGVATQLHQYLFLQPISQSPADLDSIGILETLFKAFIKFCSPLKTILSVAQPLLQHLHSRNARVTSMRATVIYPFRSDDYPWPLVEWTERDNSGGMAIFQIDERSEVCSSLIHYSEQSLGRETNAPWGKCSIIWRIANLGDLKRLFGGVQHTLGISKWSTEDYLKLYRQSNPGECSEHEYLVTLNWIQLTEKNGPLCQARLRTLPKET